MKNIKILLIVFVSSIVINSFSGHLLNAIANIFIDTPHKKLWRGISSNNLRLTKEAILAGANVNTKKDHYAPLNAAVILDHVDIASLLIAAGANVDELDKDQQTSLHMAASEDMAKLLINNGADVNARDIRGETPIFKVYDETIINLLAKEGARLDVENDYGHTPLREAIRKNPPEFARCLIENKADVNLVEDGENVYLKQAKETKNQESIKLIKEAIRMDFTRAMEEFITRAADEDSGEGALV